jgi:hypothetical protein
MLLRARSKTALCLSVVSFLFTPAIVRHRHPEPPRTVVSAFHPTDVALARGLASSDPDGHKLVCQKIDRVRDPERPSR